MLGVVAAIAPVFVLIVAGWGFKRTRFPGNEFWAPAERLSYYVLLPALVIHSLATADLAGLQIERLAATGLSLIAVMTALCLILRLVIDIDGPGYTSLMQGAVRLNAYLGFAIAAAFFGPAGVTVTAVFIAFMMPTVNVISIGVLAVFGSGGKPGWWRIPVQIVTNPLIIACALGAAINMLGLPQPAWAMGVLAILGKAALPLALLCVGAGLDLAPGKTRHGIILIACVLKLAVMPAVAWALGDLFGLTGLGLAVTMMMAATPASPATYVLARQLGGDAELMAGIITAETALSVVSLSIVLAWVGGALS